MSGDQSMDPQDFIRAQIIQGGQPDAVGFRFVFIDPTPEPPPTNARELLVAEQLGALLRVAPDDWHGGAELPPPDVDAPYAEQLNHALWTCQHGRRNTVVDAADSRVRCSDCGAEWHPWG